MLYLLQKSAMIERKKYLDKIEDAFIVLPIVVLIGARQVGKTSLMKMFRIKTSKHFMNGQDPETADLFHKLSTIEAYLKVQLNEQLEGYLLLDEFQYIHGISTMMKLLTDKYDQLKILCTGSSSLDILKNVEESLAGRVRIIEVLSLSFEEYLLFKDDKLHKLFTNLSQDTESTSLTMPIETALDEYIMFGGLPRAALISNPDSKIEILDDIYKTYLLKDVRSYIANEHFVAFNKLLRILSAQIGNLVNISELSRSTGLTFKSCESYLELLEQMYIIKLIEPYYVNRSKVIVKMKKVYFCDLGLRNCIESNFNEPNLRPDNGALFENFVMLELWRGKKAAGSLQFFRTADGSEVDFVINQLNDRLALECKFKRLEKPIGNVALNNFCDQEGIQKRYLVNRNLNDKNKGVKYIQGFLVDKIF